MRRLPRLAAGGAAVVLAVGPAVNLVDGPRDHGRAAVTSSDPADGATLARAPTEVELTAPSGDTAGRPAPASGHEHDIDPVSAGLLVADGIAALAVALLLMRRPRRPRRPAPVGR
jgi:hypothetical protein